MKYIESYWGDVAQVVKNIPNVEKLQGKSILITGATGMVCSSVVDIILWLNNYFNANIQLLLAGRSKNKIMDRFKGVLKESDYIFIDYDATKVQELNYIKTDYIIHGASNSNPAIYAKEPVETLMGNIIGLQTVLDVAKNNRGSRLLYISSSEVYGNRMDESNEPYKEEDYGYVDILNPRACYPNGKRTAETLCICYGQEYSVDTVIARLGHIYGPSITKADTRASAAFTRNVSSGNDIVMKSSGAQLRSYCYTLDCASAILAVLLNGKSGEAYNISNKESIASVREIAEELAITGGVNVVFENPTDAEQKSYNLMNNSALNAEKLEGLGWRAIFDLKSGVRKTLQYYV